MVYGGRINAVVMRVSSDELDVDPLHAVGDGDDQTVVIALDVEYHPVVSDDAGIAELRFHICRTCPLGKSRGLMP